MYWIFAIGGYVAAFLTAFYAFRIGFRVVTGRPCEEARELEDGHLAHGEPENPATGEAEDTDVGFPGPEHHIAERELPMRIAMSVLAVLALFGGLIQIPGVDHVLENFLDRHLRGLGALPTSPCRPADAWLGLLVGGIISISGIGLAYCATSSVPGVTVTLAERMRRAHAFLEHKWYFDELIDLLVYRPVIATGRFANAVLRARRRRRHRQRHHRPRARRRRPRARRPIGLRPRLRAAVDHRLRRPRPLLPGGLDMTRGSPC